MGTSKNVKNCKRETEKSIVQQQLISQNDDGEGAEGENISMERNRRNQIMKPRNWSSSNGVHNKEMKSEKFNRNIQDMDWFKWSELGYPVFNGVKETDWNVNKFNWLPPPIDCYCSLVLMDV